MIQHDVIVLGGGPGGSMVATVMSQQGLNVGLIEREEFPRFHIGESLLPASMPLLKATGFYDVLNSGKYITKCGARFIDYQNEDNIYFGFADGLNPDIPTAFEVERSEFDKDILAFAAASGVKVYQPEELIELDFHSDGVRVQTNKNQMEASYFVDSSGRDAWIGKREKMRRVNPDLNNVAVFAHFEGVERYAGMDEGDITIGLLPNRGWTWIIPFQGETTSVGVVASSKFLGTPDLEAYFQENVLISSTVRRFMSNAKRVGEFRSIGNYSHTCDRFYGDRWILNGDAAMFLDPIFSSGVHLSLQSGKFAGDLVAKAFREKRLLSDKDLGPVYEADYRRGAKRFHGIISMFYEGDFVRQMKKTFTLHHMRKAFTSVVAGDVWNEDNFLFTKNVL
jgi:flavin-dependent dehydrogenase